MLARGLYLTLLLGPGAPTPAPRELLFALSSASTQTSTAGRSGFQLAFETADPAALRRLLLRAGLGFDPSLRVILALTLRGRARVLVDGVITQHQVSHQPGGKATLTLTGEDLTSLMDRVDASGRPFVGMDAAAQVTLLLAAYAGFGVIPAVTPPLLQERADPLKKTAAQKGTDYAHIRDLARQVGHVFHLRPGPLPGQSLAYWGPEVRLGEPQPALSVDLGHASNVDAITFTHALTQPTLPRVTIQADGKSVSVPLPPVNPLRPLLGRAPPTPARVSRVADVAGVGVSAAILRGLRDGAEAAESVSAEANVDVHRYGEVIYPRDLIAIRGAAAPYNGLYCVTRVSTELKRGACTQRLSCARAGLFSSTPAVRV
ncbi:MAG: hypothetical protein R3B09_13185 [Nannocystaceae bacterium]